MPGTVVEGVITVSDGVNNVRFGIVGRSVMAGFNVRVGVVVMTVDGLALVREVLKVKVGEVELEGDVVVPLVVEKVVVRVRGIVVMIVTVGLTGKVVKVLVEVVVERVLVARGPAADTSGCGEITIKPASKPTQNNATSVTTTTFCIFHLPN